MDFKIFNEAIIAESLAAAVLICRLWGRMHACVTSDSRRAHTNAPLLHCSSYKFAPPNRARSADPIPAVQNFRAHSSIGHTLSPRYRTAHANYTYHSAHDYIAPTIWLPTVAQQ